MVVPSRGAGDGPHLEGMTGAEHEQVVREAYRILRQHTGRDDPITSQELSTRLGNLDQLDSTPQTRKVIRQVLDEFELPVVGSPEGYFVPLRRSEYQKAQARLTQRVEGIQQRQRLLETAWAKAEERGDVQPSLEAYDD